MQTLNAASLPLEGSHLIEASAGTGKTYNIVRIYLRLLLEKELTTDQILVMTFTVAATAEIRSRLNGFLRETLEQWDEAEGDPLIQSLKERVDTDKAKLLLQQAILQLDEAAIYTIHGFCKRALSQQAFFSGISFNANLEADTVLLKLKATQDWYRIIQQASFFEDISDRWPTPEKFIEHWGGVIDSDDSLNFPVVEDLAPLIQSCQNSWPEKREQFLKLNKTTKNSAATTLAAYQDVVELLDSLNESTDFSSLSKFHLDKAFSTPKKKEVLQEAYNLFRHALNNLEAEKLCRTLDGVQIIQQKLKQEKARTDQLDFNDLIIQLRDALTGEHRAALQNALLEQFPAALVDEFQDTDPDQYQILQSIYATTEQKFLCMIGDPKQAIYGFRGGDVFAYLKAREQVDHQWTMNTNYRSSPAVIEGYNQLFLQAHEEENPDVFGFDIRYRKVLAPEGKATSQFSDDRSAVQWVHFEPDEMPKSGLSKAFQQTIARWTAQEIIALVTDVQCGDKPVRPGDIALLVRKFDEAQLLQQELREVGLPSVYLSARQNVFQTQEALDAYRLLDGIWHFENDRRFIAALASSWIGLSIEQLDWLQHDEHVWSQWQSQFEQWRLAWQQRGLMSVLMDVLQNHHKTAAVQTERSLTNRLHIAERLQMESTRYRQPDALMHWFTRALEEDSNVEENQLRLESDDALIKIITMHGAKGLEYPIVFIPFASYYAKNNRPRAVYRYHDRKDYSAQLAFLANDEQKQLTEQEEFAEFIRLFYVATTRAEHRLYCCITPFSGVANSPVGLTLGLPEYNLETIEAKVCHNDTATLMRVSESDIGNRSWKKDSTNRTITPATFNGHIERDWWLSSFSALTRHVGYSAHSTPDRDEQEAPAVLPEDLPLCYRLAKGAEAGNLLHDTLEHCDFTQPNVPELYEKSKARYSNLTKTFEETELAEWLTDILAAEFDGISLAQLPLQKTLREAEFYFPMEGMASHALADVIAQKRGSDYFLPDRYKLKGMMHGFIDLIFEHNGKYYVADYKSTHLGTDIANYQPEYLRESIYHHHYDLQYSLYALAMHRYLRVRVPDYRPEEHFGGVYYFYLRGMKRGQSTGVFYESFTESELKALDDVFLSAEEGSTHA